MNANIQQRQSPQDTTYYDVCRPTVQRTVINRHRDEQLRLLNLGLRLNELSVSCGRCGYDRTGPVACDWCGHVTLSR